MKQVNPLFEQCLNKMPIKFSSIEFLKKARKLGVTAYEIEADHHFNFLLATCQRLASRTWAKRQAQTSQSALLPETLKLEMSDDDMIKHLKSKGYKILKQTFTEV